VKKPFITRLLATLSAAAVLGGCTPPLPREPYTIMRKSGEFSIISEQHRTEKIEWASYYFRIGVDLFGSETVSKQLFPDTDQCHSPYYGIRDIRLLPDGAALALLSATNVWCKFGGVHLARIDVTPFGQLRARRIPVPEGYKIYSTVFGRPDRNRLAYGYQSHDARLAIQANEAPPPVVLEVLRGDSLESEGAIAIVFSPDDFKMVDLGEGQVLRALDADTVLMRQIESRSPPSTIVFKQVRIQSGETVSSVSLKPSGYRPASQEARESAARKLEQIEIYEDAEYEFAIERGLTTSKPAKSNVTDFGARRLPANALKASNAAVAEILEKESQVDLIDGQLRATTSPSIRALR